MESGINADQNFYSRPPIHAPSSPEHHNNHNHNHQQPLPLNHPQQHYHSPIYEPPPLPNFESRTPRPQLPPKLPFLTTANLQAVAANGYPNVVVDGGDPAEFYRDYRGVQQSANGYTDHTNGMALIASESRPQPSSLRSNGNGTTPKHPSIAGKTLTSPYRSVSSPVEGGMGLNSPKSTPALNGLPRGGSSVKDLLKKFDSGTNTDQHTSSSTATTRRPVARVAPKQIAPEARGYSRERPGHISHTATIPAKHTPSAALRAGSSTRGNGVGRKSPERSRATQRPRFATEDQHSNNTLSSAARITRPRQPTSGPQPSKSMMNLSPISPTTQLPPLQAQNPERRPLFGEVLPTGPGSESLGFGIPPTAARRTSDSGLHPNWVGGHQRSRSDVDASPPSPTAWYRGVTPALDDVDLNIVARSSFGHNRNHSDLADTKVNTMNGVNPLFDSQTPPVQQPLRLPPSQRLPLPQKRATSKTPQSRLPVSKKRLSGSSESSSPVSRASSPFVAKTRSGEGKTRNPGSRPWSPASQVSPPASRPMSPTQKVTRTTGRGRKVEPVANGSLNAYISAAPTKVSPPLRSSRPRQPVSSASTTDRPKPLSRSTSHQVQTGMKLTRNGGFEDPTPQRIPENGPIDFAAKRLRIQRAYTKSIHENEQREIRAANMRRLSERHARDSEAQSSKEPGIKARPETPLSPVQDARVEAESSPKALQIKTYFNTEPAIPQNAAFLDDSPTLGMPGTVAEDEPASAISCATGVTEIDNEPQTEEARLNRQTSVRSNVHTRQMSNLSSQISFAADELSPEQAMYGYNQEHQGSIDIMLAPTRVEDAKEPTRNSTLRASESPPPIGTSMNGESNGPKLISSFYTSSPTQESPVSISRPSTSFESHDEAGEGGLLLSTTGFDHRTKSYHNTPETKYEPEYAVSPDTEDERQFDLPNLNTALRPSVAISEPDHDYLTTPVTDMEDEGSIGPSVSRRQSTYDPYDFNHDAPMQVNRRSHQSHWTDYSVHSVVDNARKDYSRPASGVSAWDLEKKSMAPLIEHSERPLSPTPPVPPKPLGYSPLPSPRVSAASPRIPSPSHERLPPIATGSSFLASLNDDHRLSATSGPLLQGPDYTPPLPPLPFNEQPLAPTRTPPIPSAQNHTRPSFSVYQHSHNETPNRDSSETGGDRYSPPIYDSNLGTSAQTSLEEVAQPLNVKSAEPAVPALPETEEERAARKKRLVDRKHQIRELVDTESVYLKDMNVVAEIYQGTAEACPKLDANDIKILFRNTSEIVTLTTSLLDDLKAAAAPVYSPRQARKSRESRSTTTTAYSGQTISAGTEDQLSVAGTLNEELLSDEQRHERTLIGAKFLKYLEKIYRVYFEFLRDSEVASARLLVLQEDPSVKVWLSECNIVAKDLTNAWDLDALLVKPVQRITRYQLMFNDLVKSTEKDHPDYEAQVGVQKEIAAMLDRINDKKARVGTSTIATLANATQPRRRKESDVRLGLTKMLGRSKEKTERPARIQDDEAYFKLHQQYSVNFLQLQVVLRDVEQYTRQVKIYVDDFLKYLSAIELWMRLSASHWPELESKWARFNMSMRDMGTVVLEEHISSVQKTVIQPFEKVIAAYAPPEATMKKRAKRRLDYEKLIITKNTGGKLSEKDAGKIDEYEALNQALKLDLPQLNTLTKKICNICLGQYIMIQTGWWDVWQKKVKIVLEEAQIPKDIAEIVSMFNRDYQYVQGQAMALGIVNGKMSEKLVENAGSSGRSSETERKGRPSNLSSRSRGLSVNSDWTPSLPAPDFTKRLSGQFVMSPLVPPSNVPQLAYSTPYSTNHSRQASGSPATPDGTSQPRPSASSLARPNTGRSFTSDSGMQRASNDYNTPYRRESGSTHNSYHDGPPISNRPYSGIFHSAMPMTDGPEDSARSSRASSRDRNVSGGYQVLYLAASLFEFNISATKSEAGYPYLTYQAGEIFDVIAEKGELWLAKNQDDHSDLVGWIWSKHFARLAND